MAAGESLTVPAKEAAELLAYSDSTFRRLVREGVIPGPVDPSVRPKLRRWSRRGLERYAERGRPAVPVLSGPGASGTVLPSLVEDDATPPHGIERPLRIVP